MGIFDLCRIMVMCGGVLYVVGTWLVRKIRKCNKIGIILSAMGISMVMLALGVSLSDVQLWCTMINTYKK